MKPGLVSIVVGFLNEVEFLADAVESVLAQTYTDWELLLVDDGSTDGSTALADAYVSLYPGKIHRLEHDHHQNRGASPSRNLGLRHAEGEYLAVLDADDVWLPAKLQKQVALLRQYPEAGMVYGTPLYWYSWTGNRRDAVLDFVPDTGLSMNAVALPPALVTASYPLGNGAAPCPCDLMLRTALVREIGGFEENFTGAYQLYEDQAFLAKVYLRSGVYIAKECWSWYRQRPDSCVSKVRRSGQYELVRFRFLKWLEAYIQSQGVCTKELRAALDRAYWLHSHPHLSRVRMFQQRLRYMLQRWHRPAPEVAAALSTWKPARTPQAAAVDR